MRRDQADQRDVFFFFYLGVISYANSTCKVKKGEDVDSQNYSHSDGDLCPVLSSRPSPMSVYWLATSVFHFFPSYCFGVAVKGNSIVFETYPRPSR